MIVILLLFLTTVFANTQEKFIDVLPEGEKQDFLDNVGRRFLKSVEIYGKNSEGREMTDEQLNKHNSYIQSLIDQETAAFETRRSKREDRSSNEKNKSKEKDDPKEDLGVEPFQFRNDNVDKSADDTDLAVTETDRRSYDETPLGNFTNTFDTDNVTESTSQFPIKNDVNIIETTEASTIKNSNEEDENMNNQRVSQTNLVDTTTKPVDPVTAFDNNLKPETSTVISSSQEFHNVLKETTTRSKIQIFDYDSATNSKNIYLITENNYTDSKPNLNTTESVSLEISSFKDKSTIVSDINTVTNESLEESTPINNQIFTTTTQNTAEVNTATTENYNAVTEHDSEKERLDSVTETATLTPILTTTDIKEEESTKIPKDIKFIKIPKSEKDMLVSYVANKALKNIKQELETKEKGNVIDNEIKTQNEEKTNLNHYQVYEIQWPTQGKNQPFVRSQELIKDQPNNVPLYKYSPNFTYNNPKNRLGANEVKRNSIELDTRNHREENNNVHDKAASSKIKIRKFFHLHHFNGTRKPKTSTTPEDEQPFWNFFLNPYLQRGTTSHTHPTTRRSHTHSTTRRTTPKRYTRKTTRAPPNGKKNRSSNPFLQLLPGHAKKKENDMFINLAKLHTFKIKSLMRSKVNSKVNIYMNVLKDLIQDNSKSLKQYDWLTTTVQIQSALTKILKLIKQVRQSDELYPADLQILRYLVFLHNFSLEVKKDNKKLGHKFKKRVKHLPKRTSVKKQSVINGEWIFLRSAQPDLEEDELSQLYEFLIDVQDGLFDLHESIRQIAGVTKFDRQNWYDNLKQLYLNTDEKHLRELLLHISMTRLVDLVENSSKHGLHDTFIQFVKSNKKEAERIAEEMIFIRNIIHDNK